MQSAGELGIPPVMQLKRSESLVSTLNMLWASSTYKYRSEKKYVNDGRRRKKQLDESHRDFLLALVLVLRELGSRGKWRMMSPWHTLTWDRGKRHSYNNITVIACFERSRDRWCIRERFIGRDVSTEWEWNNVYEAGKFNMAQMSLHDVITLKSLKYYWNKSFPTYVQLVSWDFVALDFILRIWN